MPHRSKWRDRRYGRASALPHDMPRDRTGAQAAPVALDRPATVAASSAPATTTPPRPSNHDGYPQPLQGFDYAFGAVG